MPPGNGQDSHALQRSVAQVPAAARSTLEIPTTGYDRSVFLGLGLTNEIAPASMYLKLAATHQPVTFRTDPIGNIETMRAAFPKSLTFVRNLVQPQKRRHPPRGQILQCRNKRYEFEPKTYLELCN